MILTGTQAQLFHVALNEKDIVYTPDDVARDVVAFFKPTGKILEPCSGDGAFMRHLPPDTEWCEIERGRDFFAEHRHFDWIVGNPPYSAFAKWLRHGIEISDNVVYLVPAAKPFYGLTMLRELYSWGGMKTFYFVGNGSELGFDIGFAIAAIHFQRGYRGGISIHFRGET